MKSLKDVKVGRPPQWSNSTERRYQAPDHGYGITKGVEIHVRKVAPLGDPMELNVRGYELSVRKADAEKIEVS